MVIPGPASGMDAFCRIGVTFDVLKRPALDFLQIQDGKQTAGFSENQQFLTSNPASVDSVRSPSDAMLVNPAPPRTLTVTVQGTGSGLVTAENISCPSDCSETYPNGDSIKSVQLTATPATGSTLDGFGGDCSGPTCTVSMKADRNVVVNFGGFTQPPGTDPDPDPGDPNADRTPPQTTIAFGPDRKIKRRRARFEFISGESNSRFECQLDDGEFAACTNPTTMNGLTLGRHVFRVRAIDLAGNVDASPAETRFRVIKKKRKRR